MAARPGAGPEAPLESLLVKVGLLPENCPPDQVLLRVLLAVSDEREHAVRRSLAAWREGFAAGLEAGRREGYAEAEADQASEWTATRRMLRSAVGPVLNPEAHARRILRSAEAAEKRDQAEHERAFAARAHATPAHLRNEVQQATVHAYPPPQGQVIPMDRARRRGQVAGG